MAIMYVHTYDKDVRRQQWHLHWIGKEENKRRERLVNIYVLYSKVADSNLGPETGYFD
jgi:hypothetical protein